MILYGLTRLYGACLRLYPRGFRAEFSEEMAAVFTQAAQEAAEQGALALGRLCLAELLAYPGALLRSHHSAQRPGSVERSSRALDGSGRELLLALAVFLLPAGMVLFMGEAQGEFGGAAAGLFLGVMLIVGWLGGIPLWSRPYIGIVLVVACYLYLFQWVVGMVRPALISTIPAGGWDPRTSLLLEIASNGMVWLMLFCLTLLVVALLAVFNRFQPLLARVRHDWTLLSYVMYGESVFALALLFGSHRSEPNYAAAGLLCLLAGVWFYARSPSRRQRLLALLACLTLAVGVAALERWPLAAGGGGVDTSEAGRLLLAWFWMVTALLLPGLLVRLPRAGNKPTAGPLPSA